MTVTRRQFLEGTAALGAAAILASTLPMPAVAESFSPMELLKPGKLKDMSAWAIPRRLLP